MSPMRWKYPPSKRGPTTVSTAACDRSMWYCANRAPGKYASQPAAPHMATGQRLALSFTARYPMGDRPLRPRSWSWPDDRSRLQVVELHVLDSQFVLPDAKQVIQADLVRTKAGRQRHRPFVLPPSLCGPSSSRLGAPRSCARSEPGDLPHHARTSRMRWLFATTISSRRTTASNVSMNGTSTVAMVSLPASPRATLITDFVPGQLPALPIVRPSKSTNSPAGPKALSSPVPAFATTIRPSASRVVPTTR